uniref:Secreted protein n=1 Tax=Arundo donax TaxID=35708 RepID=A0A0A9E5H0_ARUDO
MSSSWPCSPASCYFSFLLFLLRPQASITNCCLSTLHLAVVSELYSALFLPDNGTRDSYGPGSVLSFESA